VGGGGEGRHLSGPVEGVCVWRGGGYEGGGGRVREGLEVKCCMCWGACLIPLLSRRLHTVPGAAQAQRGGPSSRLDLQWGVCGGGGR
jgi:hypothetical protein